MIVRPADFLKCDSRFKHWGKVFTAKDFDENKDNGYAIGGKFVRWGDNVALNAGEFLVVAAETGSRGHHSYDYKLVIGGPTARLIAAEDPLWKEYLAKREATFPEAVVAKSKNNTLYRMGLFAVYLAIQAEGGETKTELPVYLSQVDDETLAAELWSRGWTCEREPDGASWRAPPGALAELNRLELDRSSATRLLIWTRRNPRPTPENQGEGIQVEPRPAPEDDGKRGVT